MERVTLFEEFRLIERSESEINGAWKGAHLLLFFMAFVFGSFCTFCFHMLMYLFDEKCVLFPKLLSLTSLRHNVIYEFIPSDKETADMLPVDFVGTQWLEKSACYLPTYVPLVSGIFGLVWTTMFLMCSTGSTTLTGLQRPWRVLLPIFVFSLAMGGLCVYSSAVTHYGLNELCIKLGEITGSATCTYTVNVATLAYERRIRGVYQAIRLTIFSAWLHTICWLSSALLVLVRVLLAVDFQLVRINADLIGNIEKMLEHHEKQIRTVSPDAWFSDERGSKTSLLTKTAMNYQYKNENFNSTQTERAAEDEDFEVLYDTSYDDILYISKYSDADSKSSLRSEGRYATSKLALYDEVPVEKHFIVKMTYDLVDNVVSIAEPDLASEDSSLTVVPIARQLAAEKFKIGPKGVNFESDGATTVRLASRKEAKAIAKGIRRILQEKLNAQLHELHSHPVASAQNSDSSSKRPDSIYNSTLNITDEMKNIIETRKSISEGRDSVSKQRPVTKTKKSNLKHAAVQAGKPKNNKSASPRVQISEPDNEDVATETAQETEKETQTSKNKEKQD